MSVIGYPLGILIGVITGAVFNKFLSITEKAPKAKLSTFVTFSGQILALPTFWFGGPWITTQFLQQVNLEEVLPGYLISLTLTFLLTTAFPLFRHIVKMGNEIAASGGGKSD
jgi:hypothetical protein